MERISKVACLRQCAHSRQCPLTASVTGQSCHSVERKSPVQHMWPELAMQETVLRLPVSTHNGHIQFDVALFAVALEPTIRSWTWPSADNT
jgi:hypothetical protein